MRLLITGAFGNIGKAVLEEAYKRGHKIIVFEVDNKLTRKYARKYRKKVEKVIFGDIRNYEDIEKAVNICDGVIHLAAIIPPTSKKHRELTMNVNYGGTKNLVSVINKAKRDIPLIFTSSASVMGPTQLQDKLVDRNDPLVVSGNYEESKIKCEGFLNENARRFLIFRLAGVLPVAAPIPPLLAFSLMEESFDMHPDMRIELIIDIDVATALINGVEKLSLGTTQNKQAYILGGGKKNGCQLIGAEFLSRMFKSFSLYLPDRKYFTLDVNAYHLDWYDTKEVQKEFNFQNHSVEDYIRHMKRTLRKFKIPILLFRKIIMNKLVKMSPYYDD